MKWNKYTLDRFEGDSAVFLKYPNETESLLIHCSELTENLKEGDIVRISGWNDTYKVELLEDETMEQKDKVRRLLEQLKKD
ncbi:DUF3006 domain-containing protein [Psychrobacillus sp. FSL H8-0484]|uniref:DUF3006 domain-containing protein n=1 Tax=Psychrobacillus sp. FSL H8-0484 TaxID=2921390 RepID=UPI0030F854BA